MKFVRYLLLCNLFMVNVFGAITGFDVVAINKIEKEIQSLLQKKPSHWQQQVKMRIDQLEKQYVPKGYSTEKIAFFKHMMISSEQRPQEVSATQVFQQQEPLLEKRVEEVETELKDLLAVPEAERSKDWKALVNKHIFALAIKEPEKAQEYFEKMYVQPITPQTREVESSIHVVQERPQDVLQQQEPETRTQDIQKELDGLLRIPEQDRPADWKAMVNKNIFALGTKDPEKAQAYLEEIYTSKEEPVTSQESAIGAEPISGQVVTQTIAEQTPVEQTPVEQATVEQAPVEHVSTEQTPVEQIPVEQVSVEQTPVEVPVEQTSAEQTSVEQGSVDQTSVEVAPQEQAAPEQEVVNKEKKIGEISQRIDQLFALPQNRKTSAWEKEMEDLIFELSLYDKEKAHTYLKKIYAQISAAQPVQVAPITPTAPQQGTPPKQGTPPPPPPMTGGPKAGPPPLPPGGKVAPKAEAITPGKLKAMLNSDLLTLLNNHLVALDKNWNDADKSIKVPGKYGGEKLVVIHGTPEAMWENTLDRIKKVVLERKLLPENDLSERINKHIDFVREEKIKAAKAAVKEEKEVEEDPKEELKNLLILLFSDEQMKPTEVSWQVGAKRAIQQLNAFDHQTALEYQEKYIQLLPKERRFIKP